MDSIAIYLITFVALAFGVRHLMQRRRRKSLHQEGGVWVWTEWHGGQRSSDVHPDTPGGAWYSGGSDGHGASGGWGGDGGGGGD